MSQWLTVGHAAQPLPPREGSLLFGPFALNSASAQLTRDGHAVPLTPKAYAVLAYLAEHAGRLVTKQELIDAAWADVFVGDAALKVCIREIRRALDDDVHSPRYIETAHRRGYRFIAPVAVRSLAAARRRAVARASRSRRRAARADDALRAQRRREYRLSGDWRRPARSGVRDGLGLAPRVLLDRARRSRGSCAGWPRSRA